MAGVSECNFDQSSDGTHRLPSCMSSPEKHVVEKRQKPKVNEAHSCSMISGSKVWGFQDMEVCLAEAEAIWKVCLQFTLATGLGPTT